MFALVIGLGGFGAVTAAPQVFVSPIAPPGPQALLSPLIVPQTVTSSEDPVKGWKLLYSPPVPDLFSGAASYAYPIEVPAGRNGLQPSVNLVYSSRAIDGLLDIGAIDPGPIALGWSLNFMDIVREGVHDWYDGAHYTQSFPDQFSLLIDGTGYELQPDTPGAGYGRYHAKDLPGYYIERRNERGGGVPLNETHEYWFVRLPDGTQARLGYTPNSEQVTYDWVLCDTGAFCGVQGNPYWTAASRWRVDVMTDTFGNTMAFSYVEANKNIPDGSNPNKRLYWFQQSRPAEINYNAIASGWGSQIKFLHTTDADPTGQLINVIQVYNAGALIREYRLNQGWQWNNTCGLSIGTYVVNSIQEWDGTGAAALPATTFQYQPLAHGNGDCYQFSTLYRVANGYGAATEFDFISDGRKAGSMGYSYRVSEQRVFDGLNASSIRTQYVYGTPCYNQSNGGVTQCTGFGRIEGDGPLVGHAVVTRTVLDFSGAALSKDVHRYYIYNGNHPLRGREYSVKTLTGGNQLLAESSRTFTTTAVNQTTFTYLTQSDVATYDGGVTATQRITYTYDNLGNLLARFEHGDPAITGDERRTYWDYAANTNPAVWIVNKPKQESVYTGLTGTLAAQTRNVYDNLASYNSPPTKGALTRVERWDGSRWITATQTAYDVWGNPVVITDALTHTTTTVYDAQYHLYPVQIANATNQTTTMTYDMALGVVTQVTDPNGAVTTYAYDTFRRLLRVARPYDSDALPTIEYQYTDVYSANGLQGLRITQKLREVSGDPNAVRVIHTFYDSLGREVQTRAEANDGSQQAVTNIVYDARGQVQSSYTPAFETASADFVRATGWNMRPSTQTQYDALGRTIVITNTDGTVVRTAYRGRSTGVLDANGHQRISTADAYGRLIAVSEYTNTLASVNFTTPAYANTTYRYDALNNLTRVTDALSNTTIITYNALSQKMAMSDPDMGVWQYAYDAAGNLTRQTDGRGQRVCFTYDALNRLTGKHYRGDDNCPTINPTFNVTYTYDLGAYGIGRRTSMSDEAGSTTWNYDARGRLLVDSRTLPGVRAFGLGYAYDAMDRITAITYPNGEVVTQTYNAAAQVIGVTGANTYASGLAYNAQGQIQQMNLGNTLVTQYAYDPLNFRLKSLQTGSLLNFQYGYDAVGNVTRITDTVNSTQIQTFSYDALDRLTNAATNASGNGQYSESYSYNSIGNILNKGGSTYQYADSLHIHAVTNAGSNSYSYDANGNMLSRNESGVGYTQQWDAENRLKVVTNTLTREVTKFIYDGDGARVLQIYSGTYTSTTIYLGSPAEITILGAPLPPPTATIPPTMTYRAYLPVVMGGQPVPPRTQPLANETWKMYYVVGNRLVAMRVLTVTGSTLYYLGSDHLGSTSMIMDANGNKMGEMRYRPFGEIRYTWGISPTNIGFTGQRADSYIKLVQMGARWYSPELGRWLSPDTIVPDPSNPQSLNRYAYVNNRPLNFTDPSGHRPCEDDLCSPPPSLRRTLESLRPSASFRKPFGSIETIRTVRGPTANHIGRDYSTVVGTSLYASANGVVIIADACSLQNCVGLNGQTGPNVNGGYGNVLVIEYPYQSLPDAVRADIGLGEDESLYMLYAHLESAPEVQSGDNVRPGQLIGHTGNTGNSTAAHLHLEPRIGETGSLPFGDMCTASCGPATVNDPYPRFRQWYRPQVFRPFDPNILRYYTARELRVMQP